MGDDKQAPCLRLTASPTATMTAASASPSTSPASTSCTTPPESVPTRIDLPWLMRALNAADRIIAYDAGKMLAHCVTNCEEHREALTAQQESVIAPLVCHLASGEAPLVHNATLLLGHCLMTNSEFRQTF